MDDEARKAVRTALDRLFAIHAALLEAYDFLIECKLFRRHQIQNPADLEREIENAAAALGDEDSVDSINAAMDVVGFKLLAAVKDIVGTGVLHEAELLEKYRPSYARHVDRRMRTFMVPRGALTLFAVEHRRDEYHQTWTNLAAHNDVANIPSFRVVFDLAMIGWKALRELAENVRGCLEHTVRYRYESAAARYAGWAVAATLIIGIITMVVTLYASEIRNFFEGLGVPLPPERSAPATRQ